MTQTMIETLNEEEFCAFLAYGDPVSLEYTENHSHLHELDWISTLASTTYPGMTFGYKDVHYMSTVV